MVIDTLMTSPLGNRFDLVRVSTHRDSDRARKALHGLAGIFRAALLLALRRVDVVYLQTSSGFSLRRKGTVAMFARIMRQPYIVHVHAGDFDQYLEQARPWESWFARSTLRGAALVVTLTPSWERRLQALVDCQTTVIPNPVLIPARPASLDVSPPIVVCLGRLGEQKGSLTLVNALALLDGAHADTRLVLAGDGDLAGVRAAAQRLGVSDRVEVPGWIGPKERDRVLRGARMFALPSRGEGLPIALLEAMAYGLPSVVAPVGGVPDIFEDGRHGYLVPPDDPVALATRIRLLLDDSGAARRMGTQARQWAETYVAVDVVAGQVAAAIDSVLERSQSGS